MACLGLLFCAQEKQKKSFKGFFRLLSFAFFIVLSMTIVLHSLTDTKICLRLSSHVSVVNIIYIVLSYWFTGS